MGIFYDEKNNISENLFWSDKWVYLITNGFYLKIPINKLWKLQWHVEEVWLSKSGFFPDSYFS